MAGKYRNLYYTLNKYLFSFLPDSLYHNLLGWIMHKRFGIKYKWMNIKKPVTFSEKIQWLKKNGPTDIKAKLADKYEVREYVKNLIGNKYLVDLLPLNSRGDMIVENVEDIDWDLLPNQFVLKLTKGSGFNVVCFDKNKFKENKVLKQLKKWLRINNFYLSREPHYKGKNRIIMERLLEYNIKDYKFFCFAGEPYMFKIDVNRFNGHRANYFDMNFNLLDIDEGGCNRDPTAAFSVPKQFEEMVEIVKILSKGWPFVRIDLYVHADRVYFGEMTFHPAGGYTPLSPREWEYKLGKKIII